MHQIRVTVKITCADLAVLKLWKQSRFSLLVCGGSLYLQPEESGSDSFSLSLQGVLTTVRYGIMVWNEKKNAVISHRLLCCVGGVIQLLKTPQTTSSNHA